MSEETRIRVFSVDDHALLREGIAAVITNEPDMIVVAQASTGREAVQQFRQHQPDITLMDLRLPDMSGIDALIAIRADAPDARIIMLTTFEGDVEMQRALEAGARGYLLKSMPPKDLVAAIRQVHAGRKSIPTEVAAQLAEHLGEEVADRARDRRPLACGGRQQESRYCRAARHLGRDRQGPHEAHHGEARRQRSDAGGGHRHPSRHHPVVSGAGPSGPPASGPDP